ncbi:ATP-NAD kinase [Marasmius fiardii PR-910]|nr:ATP-NAD kinase [Marasmius fiardii PR-910]
MSPSASVTSPDTESFSTPPSTPGPVPENHTSTRRSSRPSSLQLESQAEWAPDVILEGSSPVHTRKLNGEPTGQAPHMFKNDTVLPSTTSGLQAEADHHHRPHRPIDSPCFVHSQLDKGAFPEWLRNKQNGILGTEPFDGSSKNWQSNGNSSHSSPSSISESYDDDSDFGSNLTRQLAETAVGVREMSKQLGRARIHSNIQNILIITKARDNRLIKLTRQLALYLMLRRRPGQQRGLVVYVDHQLRTSRRFDAAGIARDHPELFVPFPRRRTSSSNSLSSMASGSQKDDFNLVEEGQLRYWTSNMCSQSPHLFDFVVTLGGDGTVLFTSWLFQRVVPPVLPFALGSLGFLTNFDFADHEAVMDYALDSGIRVNLRMRFTCTVYRAVNSPESKRKAVKKGETGEIMMKNIEKGGWEALEGGWSGGPYAPEYGKVYKDKEIMCFTTRAAETFEVINDLVVDRGPSPYVSLLELFGDEHHMTTVQADGLTVSTPTGSTAYSLSAGGSLVHPEIPALLITPICPHTLSFRPMLLPDSMELRICVPFNSRSTAWASFDGRGRVELKQGDHIKVTASKYPFPTVCADKQSTDWFHSISRTLKWNERERQKSFVVVEEGPETKARKKKKRSSSKPPKTPMGTEIVEDEEEDEVSEEEDDKFDIDDSSPEAASTSVTITNAPTARDEIVGREKATENITEDGIHKALSRPKRSARSRSRSRSGIRSGIDSPNRFADPDRHPHLTPRHHVDFDISSADSSDSGGQHGMRDDLHAARRPSNKNRIPKDREDLKTPTAIRGSHSKSRSSIDYGHRAFAVWGHDESDSNASDSDA